MRETPLACTAFSVTSLSTFGGKERGGGGWEGGGEGRRGREGGGEGRRGEERGRGKEDSPLVTQYCQLPLRVLSLEGTTIPQYHPKKLEGSSSSTCIAEIHCNSGCWAVSAMQGLRGRNILNCSEFLLRKCSQSYPLATIHPR